MSRLALLYDGLQHPSLGWPEHSRDLGGRCFLNGLAEGHLDFWGRLQVKGVVVLRYRYPWLFLDAGLERRIGYRLGLR